MNLDTSRLEFINPSCETIFGYTPEEMTAMGEEDRVAMIHPDDLDLVYRKTERPEGDVLELRFRNKNGDYRWTLLNRTIVRDDSGRPLYRDATARDITERKLAEDLLRESEERMTAVMGSLTEGIMFAETGGPVSYWNAAALAIFGYASMEECRGNLADLADTFEVLGLDDNSVVPVAEWPLSRVMRGEVLCDWEVRLRRRDHGWEKVLAFSGCPIRGANGETLAFVSTSDITKRREGELALVLAKAAAERANIAKSRFLAAASHDLRQPVQSLTLLLSAIKGQVKDKPKAASAVEMAKAAVDSLNSQLIGILDIPKLEAGVVTPIMASGNLGEIVGRLANEYAPRAAAGGLTLRHVSSALWVRTDVALMERIARNLIENAQRYTEKGGILIGLRRRGGDVRLDVIDTGIGIPADKQAEIFDDFRQLDNSTRDSSRGLGLGLAIVSRLANLIGARVEVASRLGYGTRFSLLLPHDRTAPLPPRAAPAYEDAGGRILIIEDNSGVRQAYEIMLKEWGYETLSAASGEKALDLAAKAKWGFDGIIADHRLGPGLNGAATAAEIALRSGRSYPTMLVTGDTSKECLREISSKGFALLHKPVEADDLRRTLASLLRGNGRPSLDSAS